jgi:hypothetical protein
MPCHCPSQIQNKHTKYPLAQIKRQPIKKKEEEETHS